MSNDCKKLIRLLLEHWSEEGCKCKSPGADGRCRKCETWDEIGNMDLKTLKELEELAKK